MTRKRSPFVGYTEEEVIAFETCTYILQVGSDIYDVRGQCVFNKKSAYIHYGKVMRELLDQLRCGNEAEKKDAGRILMNLKVLPLKLH